MQINVVANTTIQSWNHEWLLVDRESCVAQESRIEDLIDRCTVVVSSIGYSFDRVTFGFFESQWTASLSKRMVGLFVNATPDQDINKSRKVQFKFQIRSAVLVRTQAPAAS